MSDDVFSQFKEHSVAEFFRKNKQMLGFSGKVRSLTTIVHELVTNSLDAAEEGRILPNITVELTEVDKDEGRYIVRVEDNGTGIPEHLIGKALGMMLAGTKFHRYVQQRGQQGIGAAGVTMYAQLTTGKPVKVVSGYKGTKIKCEVSIDIKTNRPIVNVIEREPTDWHGLIYEAEVKDVKYDKSSYGVYEYLKRTALANPHAEIVFIDPSGERHVFPRSVEEIPPKPKPVKPHPLGVTTSDLIDFAHYSKEPTLGSFLRNTFSRLSQKKLEEIKEQLPDINFRMKPRELTWEQADRLVNVFKKIKWISPSADGIYPIGAEQIKKSIYNILNPEFCEVVERSPKVYKGGVPFIVEVGLAYGGDAGKKIGNSRVSDVMRFANRAPLLFDAGGCAITESAKSIDWKRYGIQRFDEAPITLIVNVSSVHIPYTGAGKQALASEQEIVDEIRNAIMEAARKLQVHIRGKVRERERATKIKSVLRYVKQLTADLTELAEFPDREFLNNQLITLVETKYGKRRPNTENEMNGTEKSGTEKNAGDIPSGEGAKS